MRRMKRLIRQILPVPMFNALRWTYHTQRLNRVPALTVDAAVLPKAAEVSFLAMLENPDIAAGWEKARRAIGEVYVDVPGTHAIDHESRRAIYWLIRHFQPRTVLEIGTNSGAATLHIARAMKSNRHGGSPPRLITLDVFDVNNPATPMAQRYRVATPPRVMLAQLDCAEMVEFRVAQSTAWLARRAVEVDFIVMDHASTDAALAYQDIVRALGVLRPGGQLLLHPCFPDGKPLRPGDHVATGFFLALRRLQRENSGLVALPWPTPVGLALLARA